MRLRLRLAVRSAPAQYSIEASTRRHDPGEAHRPLWPIDIAEYMERREPAAFETEIYAKDWNAGEFRRELQSVKPGQTIAIGTATDPYQPAERRFERTRRVLEAMAGIRGISVFVTTKSHLVSR